jgi:hypothetical protein
MAAIMTRMVVVFTQGYHCPSLVDGDVDVEVAFKVTQHVWCTVNVKIESR